MMHSLPNWGRLSRKKLRLLSLLGIALVTVVLLAAGLSEMALLPGQPFPLAGILQALREAGNPFAGVSLPFDLMRLVMACVWLLLILSIIGFIVSSEIRKEVFRRFITYLLWGLLVYGLIISLPPFSPFGEPEESGPAGAAFPDRLDPAELLPAPPDFIVNPPQWFVFGVSFLIIALLLGSLWGAWYFVKARSQPSPDPLEAITQEAQAALRGLQSGQNLKDTVMRCYAEMSRILSEQRRIQRPQGMTPREFEQYLAQSGLHLNDIRRLTRLFETARYGSKSPGPQAEQEAIACLSAIVQTYGPSA